MLQCCLKCRLNSKASCVYGLVSESALVCPKFGLRTPRYFSKIYVFTSMRYETIFYFARFHFFNQCLLGMPIYGNSLFTSLNVWSPNSTHRLEIQCCSWAEGHTESASRRRLYNIMKSVSRSSVITAFKSAKTAVKLATWQYYDLDQSLSNRTYPVLNKP